MNCPACGKEINDHAKFCKYCGNKIEDTQPEVSNEQPVKEPQFIRCPKCGKEMKAQKSFCTNCGASLNEPNEVVEKEIPETPKKSRKAFMIGAIVLVVVICAALVMGYMKISQILHTDFEVESSQEDDRDRDDDDSEEEEDEDEEEKKKSDPEVDEEVLKIEKATDRISAALENKTYDQKIVEAGFSVATDKDELKAFIVSDNYSKIDYECRYYFDDDELIFARYEGATSHDFYFQDEEMIRWIKYEDGSELKEGTTHDKEDTAEYRQWEKSVLQNAKNLKTVWQDSGVEIETEEENSQYILPGSDTRIIKKSELDALTKEEVKLARNEIYARHGRIFDDAALRNYFYQFDWYYPTIQPDDFKESMLNSYELQNRDIIVAYEKEKGYR